MKILAVKNLKWANPLKTAFSCEVNYEEIQFEEWTPVGVCAEDPYPWINELWDSGTKGLYGEIQPYSPETGINTVFGDNGKATVKQFFNKLTDEEKIKLLETTKVSIDVKLWYDLAIATNEIQLGIDHLQEAHSLFDGHNIFADGRLEQIYQTTIPISTI